MNKAKRRRILVITVIAAFCWLAATSVLEKSPAFDEPFHITGGYSYWKTNDYRIHPTNGNLTQRWIALPLLAMDLNFPSTEQESWRHPDYFGFEFGREFLFQMDNDADAVLWWSRLMIVLLAALLLLTVAWWSHRLFGGRGAIISLVLTAFCPTVLAHGRLATSDLAAAFSFTLSALLLWRVLHRISMVTVSASCCALAAASLVKFSAALFAVVGVAAAAVRLARGQPLPVWWNGRRRELHGRARLSAAIAALAVLHFLAIYLAIWCAYGFRYSAFAEAVPGRDKMDDPWSEVMKMKSRSAAAVIDWARRGKVLPEAYLYGLGHTLRFSELRPTYFCGECSLTGWWYFHPYCYLVKSTIPALLLTALALATYSMRWRFTRMDRRATVIANDLYRTAPLTILIAVYWIAAVTTNLNLGVRHLLPVFPPTFILCGVLGFWYRRRLCWGRQYLRWVHWGVTALLVWHAAEAVGMYPHYIPYFNQLVGGPDQGYRHLVDNNLDWGQDLPALARWLKQNRFNGRSDVAVHVQYLGSGVPAYYGVKALPLKNGLKVMVGPGRPLPLKPGVYCVSATTVAGANEAVPRWTQEAEGLYRQLIANMSSREAVQEAGGPDSKAIREARNQLAYLQYARLLAYLRGIEPDEKINYSIHVYYLDQRELKEALLGPMLETPMIMPPSLEQPGES